MTPPAEELTCRELVELVTDYLEGALSPAERARFEAHVAECPGCERYLGQVRATLGAVRATAELDARPELGALMAAFRDWKRGAAL